MNIIIRTASMAIVAVAVASCGGGNKNTGSAAVQEEIPVGLFFFACR